MILANIGTATLIGGANNNALDGAGFSGSLALQLSGGTDTLTGNATNTTLLAAAGGSDITLDDPNKGTIGGGGTFDGITALTGGAGIDNFFFVGAGSLTGALTGVGGNDKLDVSASGGAPHDQPVRNDHRRSGGLGQRHDDVGRQRRQQHLPGQRRAPDLPGHGCQHLHRRVADLPGRRQHQGRHGERHLPVPGRRHAGRHARRRWRRRRRHADLAALGTANFALASATAGTASGITGGYLNIVTLVGNNGTSSLTGTSTGSTYVVAGPNSGTVNDGVGTTNFSGIGSLAGGTGADQFQVADAGSLTGSINGGGGAGVNTLDLRCVRPATSGCSRPTAAARAASPAATPTSPRSRATARRPC